MKSAPAGCATAIKLLLLFGTVSLMGGCEGRRPEVVLSTCLQDDKGLAVLKNLLRESAARYDMKYLDAGQEVAALDIGTPKVSSGKDTIFLRAYRGDNTGVGVTNVGLAKYQVAVGFSEGSERERSREFAADLSSKIASRWPTQKMDKGDGVSRMQGCD